MPTVRHVVRGGHAGGDRARPQPAFSWQALHSERSGGEGERCFGGLEGHCINRCYSDPVPQNVDDGILNESSASDGSDANNVIEISCELDN